MTKISGIYKITNTINKNIYIGSATSIQHRWNRHKSELRKNRHHSNHLQRAWNKHGSECFDFSVVELCSPQLLIEREQYYIDTLNPEYNIAITAGSQLGTRRSEESKAKMSASAKGKIISEETKAKMRIARSKQAPRVGYRCSPETRRKVSIATTKERHPMWGKHHTEESKQRIRNSKVGKSTPQEIKDKISKSIKIWWENRKMNLQDRDDDNTPADKRKILEIGIARVVNNSRMKVK